MENVIMTKQTLGRYGGDVKCKICGKEIMEGEQVLRKFRHRKQQKSSVSYIHKSCDEERRY